MFAISFQIQKMIWNLKSHFQKNQTQQTHQTQVSILYMCVFVCTCIEK